VRFERGDHLRVRRRPLGYFHHGVYVSDERIIQFGGGICDKPRATIDAVALADFHRGGTVEVVRHGGHTWFGAWRPEAESREKVVQKAEWLLTNHPRGLYDLVGYNCEHAANFCVTGWPESYQVRSYFFIRALAEWLAGMYLARRFRLSRQLSRLWIGAIVGFSIFGIVTVLYSWHVSKHFWDRVGLEWRAYELTLLDDGSVPLAERA
jgi:hypothetical protein